MAFCAQGLGVAGGQHGWGLVQNLLTSSPRTKSASFTASTGGDSRALRRRVPASLHHRFLGRTPFVHERVLPRPTGRVPPGLVLRQSEAFDIVRR